MQDANELQSLLGKVGAEFEALMAALRCCMPQTENSCHRTLYLIERVKQHADLIPKHLDNVLMTFEKIKKRDKKFLDKKITMEEMFFPLPKKQKELKAIKKRPSKRRNSELESGSEEEQPPQTDFNSIIDELCSRKTSKRRQQDEER